LRVPGGIDFYLKSVKLWLYKYLYLNLIKFSMES
jgi:hypothetical protein